MFPLNRSESANKINIKSISGAKVGPDIYTTKVSVLGIWYVLSVKGDMVSAGVGRKS